MTIDMIAAISTLIGGIATLITILKPKKKTKSEIYYKKVLLPFLKNIIKIKKWTVFYFLKRQ